MFKVNTLDQNGTVLESEYFMSQPDTVALKRQAVLKWGKGVSISAVSVRYVPRVAKNSTQVFKK